MFTLQSLRQDPRYFRALLGVTVETFDAIAASIRPAWDRAITSRRLPATERKRRVGGGRKLRFPTVEEQLFVFLLWARLYPTYLLLEAMVGGDEATCCRVIHRIAPLLQGRIELPEHRGRRKLRSLDELKEVYPEVWEVIVDATEQRIPRPSRKRDNRKFRSGKRKAHTVKAQVIVSPEGRILHISPSVEGKRHDLRLLTDTLAPTVRNGSVIPILDRGYQGLERYLPNLVALLPVKRHRGKRVLTRSERAYNRMLSRLRIVVEHAFARLKRFRVLAEVFRHSRSFHHSVFCAIASTVNQAMLTTGRKAA